MDFRTYDAGICIMTRVLDLISGKWKPIILFLIQNEINRFGTMKKSMPKISKKILTEQLRELEHDKLISREIIVEDHPQVVVYSLTEKGISLRKLIDEMIQWGIVNFREDYTEEVIQEF